MSVFSALNLASIYSQDSSILKCEKTGEKIPLHEREECINHSILIVAKKKIHLRYSLLHTGKNERAREAKREAEQLEILIKTHKQLLKYYWRDANFKY